MVSVDVLRYEWSGSRTVASGGAADEDMAARAKGEGKPIGVEYDRRSAP